MSVQKAQIVRSRSGHDKGQLFCVMAVDGNYVLLADGKRRLVTQPKRKNSKHVIAVGEWDHPTMEKVRSDVPIRDRELRVALAMIRDKMEV